MCLSSFIDSCVFIIFLAWSCSLYICEGCVIMRSLCGVVVWEHARRLNVEREKQRKSGDSEFEMTLDIWRTFRDSNLRAVRVMARKLNNTRFKLRPPSH